MCKVVQEKGDCDTWIVRAVDIFLALKKDTSKQAKAVNTNEVYTLVEFELFVVDETTFLQSLLTCAAVVLVSATGLNMYPVVHPASECS